MNFLTDTSVVSPIMNGDRRILEFLSLMPPNALLFTSVITEAEVEYGLSRLRPDASETRRQDLRTVLLLFVDVLPVTRDCAQQYASLKLAAGSVGRTIPDNDMWIAAIAAANNMTVLHKDRHFTFIPGLDQLDWTSA